MKFNSRELMRSTLLLSVALMLAACGGGATGGAPGATAAGQLTFTVGGSVSGLSGTVVLQDNLGDNLTITANGPFTFATKVADGSPYNVTVLTQPTGLTCSVSSGGGKIASSNVGNVAVVCSKDAYNIGGTVSGLTGTVVLQDNNGDDLTVTADGTFTFATKVDYGNPYNVTVLTQPAGFTCSVSTGSGVVFANNVGNVAVHCSSKAYNLGGSVAGLTGTVVLQVNSGNTLSVATNGAFTFANQIASGSPYNVTVLTQPTGQSCSVASGTGTMGAANIANVAITCTTDTYTVGGTVSQLNGSMVLQNNVTDNLSVSVNGQFTFPTTLTYGGSYNISVLSQPTNQRCLIRNGSGNATTNISNVNLICARQMGGAMQGVALNLVPTVSTFVAGPAYITSDRANLYVADTGNQMIRKIEIATGVVTTLAGTGAIGATDGAGSTATFKYPTGITTDGTNLYVLDSSNNKIRKIVIATGFVSSLTGVINTPGPTYSTCTATPSACAVDGDGASATFNSPEGITTDGANLYVADNNNNKIRKIVIATGFVSSLTGMANSPGVTGATDGAGFAATFNYPMGITTDGANLYVTDTYNNKIRKIVIATGDVSSLTGVANTAGAVLGGAADGASADATFSIPIGITTDGANLYVSDSNNNKIRKIVIATSVVSSLTGGANTAMGAGTGDGAGAVATFNGPWGITSDGANLFVSDAGSSLIRKIQ
jgi:sugar lactone lactonase YvrE